MSGEFVYNSFGGSNDDTTRISVLLRGRPSFGSPSDIFSDAVCIIRNQLPLTADCLWNARDLVANKYPLDNWVRRIGAEGRRDAVSCKMDTNRTWHGVQADA